MINCCGGVYVVVIAFVAEVVISYGLIGHQLSWVTGWSFDSRSRERVYIHGQWTVFMVAFPSRLLLLLIIIVLQIILVRVGISASLLQLILQDRQRPCRNIHYSITL